MANAKFLDAEILKFSILVLKGGTMKGGTTAVKAQNAAVYLLTRTPAEKWKKHLFVSEKVLKLKFFFIFFRNNQMFFSVFAGVRVGVRINKQTAAFWALTAVITWFHNLTLIEKKRLLPIPDIELFLRMTCETSSTIHVDRAPNSRSDPFEWSCSSPIDSVYFSKIFFPKFFDNSLFGILFSTSN